MRTNALLAVCPLSTSVPPENMEPLSPKHTSILQSRLMQGIPQYIPPSAKHMETLLTQVQGAHCMVPTHPRVQELCTTLRSLSNCPPLTAHVRALFPSDPSNHLHFVTDC